MASIYNIPDWGNGVTYVKNTIVYDDHATGADYYYVISESIASSTKPHNDPINWGGRTNHNGSNKPHFFWKPSYSANINKRPRVKSIRFGDGYEQRIADGINNNLNVIDITFENRDEREAAAILHFLEERKETESFVFEPAKPYDKASLYVCRNWDSNFVFYDNYNIKVQFEEVPE